MAKHSLIGRAKQYAYRVIHKGERMVKKVLEYFLYRGCKHTHTFKLDLPPDTPWYSSGVKKGTHSGLQLHGCYLCGKIGVRDTQA